MKRSALLGLIALSVGLISLLGVVALDWSGPDKGMSVGQAGLTSALDARAADLDLPPSATAGGKPRLALVIGNGAYSSAPLRNAANDARDIAAKLQGLDFEVKHLLDADQRSMEAAIKAFTRKLVGGGVGLFYYAGHGLEVGGQNYLVPIGAEIDRESDVRYEAVAVGRVLDGMREAGNGLNLVVLDACRNNPYSRGFRGASRGLARMSPASGSLILYATEPGQVAADGDGRNGVFTQNLLAALDEPGLAVEQVFKRTALNVNQATRGNQTPWQEGVILGAFYFRPPSGTTPAPAPAASEPTQPPSNAIATLDTPPRPSQSGGALEPPLGGDRDRGGGRRG